MKKLLIFLTIFSLLLFTGCNKTKSSTIKASNINYEKAENVCINNTEYGDIIKSKIEKEDNQNIYEIEVLGAEKLYSCEIDAKKFLLLSKEEESIINTDKNYKDALGEALLETDATKLLNVSYDDGNFEIELQDNKYRYDLEITEKLKIVKNNKENVEIR